MDEEASLQEPGFYVTTLQLAAKYIASGGDDMDSTT